MELPSYPEADDTTPKETPTAGSRAVQVVVVAVVAAVVVVVVILHLTGVIGPGVAGPH